MRGRARTSPLPLPVRADGAPRAAPEVPGVAAGHRLVRDQPAGADGRLLPRLRGGAEAGVRASGLSAVPARGPDGVDLLQPVAAGGLVVAARPGRADPQGAVPAGDDP